MTANRFIAPPITQTKAITTAAYTKIQLANGANLYVIKAGDQPVLRIDFIFEAGKWYEQKNLVADFTNRIMREGTTSKSAFEIAEAFDYWGANFESNVSFNSATFQLYTLSKHASKLLPLVKEIFCEASFPESELATAKEYRLEQLKEQLSRSENIANRLFLPTLYGDQHPYGRISLFEDFDAISRQDLVDFYKQFYHANNFFIIVSGQFDDSLIKDLEKIFGGNDWQGNSATKLSHTILPKTEKVIYQERAAAVQTSLQIGEKCINKNHQDYDRLTIANTILGGYFGSRLMTNIREEKGYTYGIYSSLSSFENGGVFEITTDVGKEVYKKTLQGIEKETKRLQNDLVTKEELESVQNYMAGRVLRSVDGAFKYADVLKGFIRYQKSDNYLNEYLETIYSTTPQQIRDLAQHYFEFKNWVQVAVG